MDTRFVGYSTYIDNGSGVSLIRDTFYDIQISVTKPDDEHNEILNEILSVLSKGHAAYERISINYVALSPQRYFTHPLLKQ